MRRDPPLDERQRALIEAIRTNTLTKNQRRDLIHELFRLWLPKAWAAEERRLNRAEEADVAGLMIRLMKANTGGSVHDAELETVRRLDLQSVEALQQMLKRARREYRRSVKGTKN